MKIESPLTARAAVRALTASKIRELYNEGVGNPDILPFWVGEPDEPTPDFIRKAGIDSIAAGEVFYTHNQGHRGAARNRWRRLDHRAQERVDPRARRRGAAAVGLFDERNLIELSSPDCPGERLVACRNPELARLRAHKREELLAATEKSLAKIKARVDAAKLSARERIGLRVGKVINQYKVAKHFELAIGETTFTFARKHEGITAEAALDGIYIIRTSVSAAQMDAPAHLAMHARVLRRVAHARGLARADVRRHRQPSQDHARPGRTGQALQSGARQGGPPRAR